MLTMTFGVTGLLMSTMCTHKVRCYPYCVLQRCQLCYQSWQREIIFDTCSKQFYILCKQYCVSHQMNIRQWHDQYEPNIFLISCQYTLYRTLDSSLHAIMLWCHSCTTHHICYLIMHKYTTYSRSEVRIIHRFLMLRWATYIQIWNATCLVPNAISDCLYSYWKFYHEDETFMRPLWDSGYSHETLGHSKKTCYIGGT